MLNFIRKLELVSGRDTSEKFDKHCLSIANDLIINPNFEPVVLQEIVALSLLERWMLYSTILELKSLSTVHFLHVPKTGGTTFGETLGKDGKAIIISLDSLPETFYRQLLRLKAARSKSLIISRAHHGLSLVLKSNCIKHIRLIFTAYRDPIDVHISNVNMIMRRIASYVDGANMPDIEKTFCEHWLEKLDNSFENTKTFARIIITSKEYQDEMQGVYSQIFNVRGWEKLFYSNKLAVIPSMLFDDMFVDVFDYGSPPVRRNVSKSPILERADLDEKVFSKLIQRDEKIIKILSKHLIEPKELKKYFVPGDISL